VVRIGEKPKDGEVESMILAGPSKNPGKKEKGRTLGEILYLSAHRGRTPIEGGTGGVLRAGRGTCGR